MYSKSATKEHKGFDSAERRILCDERQRCDMTRCDHCGNEVVLPFSCQHCGGKFCDECRLPPNHNCVNIGTWKKKPLPVVGLSYGKGGGVTATGSGYGADSRHTTKKKKGEGIPYLKIMIAIIVLILIGIAYLVFSGYYTG
jgi:hypothetical protein